MESIQVNSHDHTLPRLILDLELTSKHLKHKFEKIKSSTICILSSIF